MEKIKRFFNFKEMSKKKKVLTILGLSSVVLLAFYLIRGGFSSSEGIELIPTNTAVVTVVNVGEVIEKMDIEDLLELDLGIVEDYLDNKKDLIKEVENESELLASIIKDPENIGVDINQDIFIYAVIGDVEEGEGFEDALYLCVSGGVGDEDKLLEIVEEIEDQMHKRYIDGDDDELYFDISEEDDYTIALVYNKETEEFDVDDGYESHLSVEYWDVAALAWDDDKFLFITNPNASIKKDINKLEDEVERLFNLESDEKLTSINSFDDFYDNKTDLCAWASPEGLDLDFLPSGYKIGLGVVGIKEKDLKECSASVFCNIGDGDVSIEGAFYPSEGLKEELEERSKISSSELSFELRMKFDDSGDNTLHVLLKSFLTIADKFLDFDDLLDFDDFLDFDDIEDYMFGYGEEEESGYKRNSEYIKTSDKGDYKKPRASGYKSSSETSEKGASE